MPDERRVTFDDEKPSVESVTNFSCEYNKADIWFTKDEMEGFKTEATRTFQEMKRKSSKTSPDSHANDLQSQAAQDTTSFLGLESCLTSSTAGQIRRRMKALKRKVMREQRRQRRKGICNPELLASIAENESDWARRRAGIIGLIHAEDR